MVNRHINDNGYMKVFSVIQIAIMLGYSAIAVVALMRGSFERDNNIVDVLLILATLSLINVGFSIM